MPPLHSGHMFPIILAGGMAPAGVPNNYMALASSPSISTVPLLFWFPFAWTLRTVNLNVWQNTGMSNDVTVNIVKTTSLGVASVPATYNINKAVTAPFRHQIVVAAEFLSGDSFDVQCIGVGTGTMRLTAVGVGLHVP